jgi:hypothetical protein
MKTNQQFTESLPLLYCTECGARMVVIHSQDLGKFDGTTGKKLTRVAVQYKCSESSFWKFWQVFSDHDMYGMWIDTQNTFPIIVGLV